jgi:hypothetical protein
MRECVRLDERLTAITAQSVVKHDRVVGARAALVLPVDEDAHQVRP